MDHHLHGLRTLRDIVLEYGAVPHPDLAALARELGAMVHLNSAAIGTRLASLQRHHRHADHWRLARRRASGLSLWVKAWPAGETAPLRAPVDGWELELALHGALELQTFRRDAATAIWRAGVRDWLGPGDARWFEPGGDTRHCWRNLSRHQTAFTLHVGSEPNAAGHIERPVTARFPRLRMATDGTPFAP